MKVLHVVKTSDGAAWAASQATCLSRAGVEVHVALPCSTGAMVDAWRASGAVLHFDDLSLPVAAPWKIHEVLQRIRRLVERVSPDLVHSHFFTNTIALRMALGRRSSLPLIFQVPGPLHLENPVFRSWDLRTSGPSDYWIGSSRYIVDHYRRAGIDPGRTFLSYYGFRTQSISRRRTGVLRQKLGIPSGQHVVGSICHVYAPKLYLGQRHGLKNHETMIEALARVTRMRPDVTGVLAGGPWSGAQSYYSRLRRMAQELGKGRILMPGALPASQAPLAWADYDCVLHIPASENCGGVIEPLAAHVPVIAASVGGLPEVVVNGRTGALLGRTPTPEDAAAEILAVLDDLPNRRRMSIAGADLVERMFDVERTASEIHSIYRHILHPATFDRSEAFDCMIALDESQAVHA